MSSLIIAGLALFSALKGDAYEERKNDLVKAMEQTLCTVTALPNGWAEMGRVTKFKTFFDALGNVETSSLEGDHPDYRFLRFLQETLLPLAVRVHGDTWKDYVDTLNAFASSVAIQDTITVRVDAQEATQFFTNCMRTLDYHYWLSSHLRTDRSFRINACTGNNATRKHARNAVLRFSLDLRDSSEWVPVAESMQRSLERWHVQEVEGQDYIDRPWFVVEMYFAFLNGERFPSTKTDTGAEKEEVTITSPYDEFIQRLPRQDLLKDIVYPDISRSTIETRLSILVRHLCLNEKIADQDFRSAIAMIEGQMNYMSWGELRRQALRKERDSVEKTDPTRYVQLTKRLEVKEQSGHEAINAFVSHFVEGNMK